MSGAMRHIGNRLIAIKGCNQAFCLAADALCGPGDEVVVARPTYFNHAMWLRMRGIEPVTLEPDADLVPRAADAEALISLRTRAIVLVTPGNPSGVEVPPDELAAFAAARSTGRKRARSMPV